MSLPLPTLEQLRTEKARRSLKEFVRQAWEHIEPDPFVPGWHIDAICDHLEACYYGQLDKLVINIPPRHSKSLLACVFFPAWVWIQNPKERFMFASYGQHLAERDARRCRRLITSDWYQKRWGKIVQIVDGSNLIQRFENTAGGYRIATSVDGKMTGEGGSFIVIDDPHKADEAQSEVTREKVCDWYDQTVSSRGNNPKAGRVCKILIMQRLHEGDLTGHLLKKSGWEHLKLPLLYEPSDRSTKIGFRDPRHKEGEILSPERFGEKEVAEFREQGSYVFSGQYQQRPTPEEGGIFKKAWLENRWEPHPNNPDMILLAGKALYPREGMVFFTVDLAASKRESADYTAIGVWSLYARNLILLDMVRKRLEGPETLQTLERLARRWDPLIWVEKVGFQLAFIQQARYAGLPIRELEADTDKIGRAMMATSKMEAGEFWLPRSAPWLDVYLSEMLTFPMGDHDDMVDVTAYACRKAWDLRGILPNKIQKKVEEDGRPPSAFDALSNREDSPFRYW